MTSLKLLEFNLRLDNIQELPYEVGTYLTKEQAFEVIKYCHNDVDATEKLFFKTLPGIELRQVLSPKYNIDFTNFNDVKVGEHIFISKIIAKGGESLVYDTVEKESGGIRKIPKNTIRTSINIGETLLPFLAFREEPFQKILEWFRNKTIKELNGVFSGLAFEDLRTLEPHYRIIKTKGKQKTLNILYKGFQYDFGVGGIHGSIEPGVYTPEDDELILDIDVEGYYPSESIQFKFEPEHLKGVYSEVHQEIKDERAMYPKKTPENTSMKLAGNGSYGKGGSEFSPLCDKQYVVQTCVNGQLLLCMLAETFTIELDFHQMIQINTDGMTIRIKKNEYDKFVNIYHRWQRLTGLKLEEASYSKMVISNVNNYLAVYTNGAVKRKGTYEYELDLHKNFSMLVVPRALEAYFVNDIPVEQFIYNHTDYYDFFKRTKINKTDRLLSRVFDQQYKIVSETEVQRITRYLVSGKVNYDKETKSFNYDRIGTSLIKEMPPIILTPEKKAVKIASMQKKLETKKAYTQEHYDLELAELGTKLRNTNMEAGYLCTSVNNILPDEQLRQLIYYPYYIDEVYKIINAIETHDAEQLTTAEEDGD
jgi:thermostable 8-oxoguanine DNA glycosylase